VVAQNLEHGPTTAVRQCVQHSIHLL
jgi:hypothetical protein